MSTINATLQSQDGCPVDVAPQDDGLVAVDLDALCTSDASAIGSFSFELAGNRSGLPALAVRPHLPLSRATRPLVKMSDLWFATVHSSNVAMRPERVGNMPQGSVAVMVQAGVLEDACGRTNLQISCSSPDPTSYLIWDGWGIRMEL